MSTETTYIEIDGNRIRYHLEIYLKKSEKFTLGYIPSLDMFFHAQAGSDVSQRAAHMIHAVIDEFASEKNYPVNFISYLKGIGFTNPKYESIMASLIKSGKFKKAKMSADNDRNRPPVGYEKSLTALTNQKSVA
jgi:hypothetical protein